MTKAGYTDITFVVDRSGSMSTIAKDMIGGFETFIAAQRKAPGKCTVSLAQFDTEYSLVYMNVPVQDVPPLRLEPRGGTALLDAVGLTINSTGARLSAMKERDRPSNVMFVIITDGEENSSREFKLEQVKKMVEKQTNSYAWDFVFLGANIDAFSVGGGMGVNNNVNYRFSAAGGQALFNSLGESVLRSRSTGKRLEVNQATYDAHLADVTSGNKKP